MKTITNELGPDGVLLCPVCGRPGTWREGIRSLTSPMVRVIIGNLNALVHRSCLNRLYGDIERQLVASRRRKLLLGFLPACWSFLRGAAQLIGLICKHGPRDAVRKFRQAHMICGIDKAKGKSKYIVRDIDGGVSYISGDL